MFKKAFRVVVVLLLLSGISHAEDRRLDNSVLTVMTLNAEFLWDGVEPEEGRVNFPWKFSQTEAEEHMREVAEIIIQSNPDIVNLVEVENENALNTLNNNFLTGRGYRAYFIKGKDTYTGQDVALLTKIDPEEGKISRSDIIGRSGSVSKSVSKNYYAKFDINNTKIALIGLHLLAFPQRADRRLSREAQADAIRTLAVEHNGKGYSVIVLGDFNDYDGDDGNRDHIDSTPITDVLSIVKGMKKNTAKDNLINVASHAPKTSRYTAFYDANRNGQIDHPNEFTSIDHLLLSPELTAKIEVVEFLHNHDPRLATDHFPVIVRLRFSSSTTPSANNARIISLLPNPPGDENQNEAATIKNLSTTQPINLTGWKLRDRAKKTWSLDKLGTLAPQEEKTIRRKGQPMAMNNGGDTIDLVDPDEQVIQSVTYTRVEEDEIVTPTITE